MMINDEKQLILKIIFIGDIHQQIKLCISIIYYAKKGKMFFKRSFIVRKDTTYFFNGQNV